MNFGLNARQKEEEEINAQEEKLTYVHISKQIDYLLERENNKALEEMKYELLDYKQELEDNSNLGKPIRNEYFKKCLFGHLENLLLNVIYIPIKIMRDDKLRQINRWFKGKLVRFNSLDTIRNRTAKNIDEIFLKEEIASDDILIQDDRYEYEEFKKHRTDVEGLEPPKNRLKEFKTKQVNPPKRFRKDEKVLADLRFNLERFKGRVGSANSSITLKSTFYATKTGQKWFSNSGVGVTDTLQPINSKKEIKYAYSYVRPEYEFNHLAIEKQIMTAKNKELAKKRNEEEINYQLIEFGLSKASYKEEREMKSSYQKMIKHYDHKFGKDVLNEEKITEEGNNTNVEVIQDLQSEEIDLEKEKEKVLYSKLKGISPKPSNIIIIGNNNHQEKTNYKVYTTINREELKKQIIYHQKEKANVLPDSRVSAMTHDKVFASRQMGSLMCKVTELDPPKTGYTHHFVPLSAFDNMNYNSYGQEEDAPKKVLMRPKTASQFVSHNYQNYKEDLLGLRKQMENYKQNEFWELEKTYFNDTTSTKKVEELKKFFQPMPLMVYPSSFLPRPKTGLLKKPFEPPSKRRKPKPKKGRSYK